VTQIVIAGSKFRRSMTNSGDKSIPAGSRIPPVADPNPFRTSESFERDVPDLFIGRIPQNEEK